MMFMMGEFLPETLKGFTDFSVNPFYVHENKRLFFFLMPEGSRNDAIIRICGWRLSRRENNIVAF